MLIDKDYIQKNLLREQEPSSLSSMALDGSAPACLAHANEALDEYNDNANAAFGKIERLLAVRDRSVTETRSRLQRDHYTERAIAESLERALHCGYLDDVRFAEGFIRMRLRASKGINSIVRDLKGHQIDAYAIPGFPDAFLEEQGSQLDNAIRLLERKPPRAKNKKQAAYAKLIRNGFSSSVASSAVKTWIAEREDQ